MHIGLIRKCAQTARAADHGVDRGTELDVLSFVVVLRFPSLLSPPGISTQSVIRCIAVRPPHGWAAARRPVLEKSYTRILKHVTVDPFANSCSPLSYRCRCCVYFTPHKYFSKSKAIFQTAYLNQYEFAGCANLIAFPPWSNTAPTRP